MHIFFTIELHLQKISFSMKDIKKIIFVVFLIILFIPILVKSLNLIKEKPLNGAFIPAEKPYLSDSTWFNGYFQEQQEKYLNENTGLHNTMVRINNQIDFSLFNKSKTDKLVIGKENYLFEDNYIFATTGTDYIGEEKIKELTQKAKQTQEILESNGIKMLFVFAPGKASFFKEYIPDRYFVNGTSPVTNYKVFTEYCKKEDVNYIDFNSYFLKLKDKSEYPLYPKAGIHWSYYGMYLCADSIISKIEKDLNKDIPEIIIKNIELSKEQKNPEYDLGDLANLLFKIETYDLAYPVYSYNQEGKHRPKVLVVGDSYYWNMYYSGIPSNVFESLDFYYYNSKYYYNGNATPIEVSSLDYVQEILKYEYIILLETDGGLNNFGFGFFDKIIKEFGKLNLEPEVLKYINAIINDPAWMKHIEEKAKQRGISTDEMIEIDARYMYEQDIKNAK